ncbi:hypothetical protein GGR92_001947 [Spirosoma lacussanchae]
MKKQFAIKPASVLKSLSKSVAKSESANVFKFVKSPICCDSVMLINGQNKPVFSL